MKTCIITWALFVFLSGCSSKSPVGPVKSIISAQDFFNEYIVSTNNAVLLPQTGDDLSFIRISGDTVLRLPWDDGVYKIEMIVRCWDFDQRTNPLLTRGDWSFEVNNHNWLTLEVGAGNDLQVSFPGSVGDVNLDLLWVLITPIEK